PLTISSLARAYTSSSGYLPTESLRENHFPRQNPNTSKARAIADTTICRRERGSLRRIEFFPTRVSRCGLVLGATDPVATQVFRPFLPLYSRGTRSTSPMRR